MSAKNTNPTNENPSSDDPSSSTSPQKRGLARVPWLRIAQIVISLSLLIWLLSRIGLREVAEQLAGIHVWLYGLAILVFLLSVAVRSVRWYLLLTPLGVKASHFDLFRLYLLGFFWNNFLPTGFGGDVVKIIALQRMSKQGPESAMSVVAERAIGLLGTSLIALVTLLIWPKLVTPDIFWLVVILCGGIVLVGGLARLDLLRWLGDKLPWLRPVVRYKKLVDFHESLRTYDAKTLMLSLLSSIPFTLCLIVDNYLIGLALDVVLPLKYYAIFTPVVSVVNLLPLSFNGLGVREYMYQLLFVPVGVSAEQAFTMAFAFNMMRLVTGMLGGVLSITSGARGLSQAPHAADGD